MNDFDTIKYMMENQIPFTFSRWGDGEWLVVLGLKPGSRFDLPKQREELNRILKSQPKYLMGMQGLALRLMGEQIGTYLDEHTPDIRWMNAEVFHDASMTMDFSFWDSFKKFPHNLMVAPKHIKKIWSNTMEIPEQNCWDKTEEIEEQISQYIEQYPHVTVGFCAGWGANIWIDDLHHKFPQHSYVDFGAVLDPLCGVLSRKYMRRPNFQSKLALTLEKG